LVLPASSSRAWSSSRASSAEIRRRTAHGFASRNGLTAAALAASGEIRDKYAKLTHRAISADRQAAIENIVLNIDTASDVAELTALLTPTVQSPLD
jgi:hypothetical protein